eukprot:11191658-Lingulodinium_polyedra.AAC.1
MPCSVGVLSRCCAALGPDRYGELHCARTCARARAGPMGATLHAPVRRHVAAVASAKAPRRPI